MKIVTDWGNITLLPETYEEKMFLGHFWKNLDGTLKKYISLEYWDMMEGKRSSHIAGPKYTIWEFVGRNSEADFSVGDIDCLIINRLEN